MLRIVCLKWGGNALRSYGTEHVNRLYHDLKANARQEFTLYCVTDDASGIDERVAIYEMPEVCRRLTEVPGKRFAKLFLFSEEFSNFIGGKFIYLDLDVLVTGDLSSLAEREAGLSILAGEQKSVFKKLRSVLRRRRLPRRAPVNSSVMAIEPHRYCDIWESFDPGSSETVIERNRIIGSDQAWVYLCAADRLECIGVEEGVYKDYALVGLTEIPDDVKVVIFSGKWHKKPWTAAAKESHPWLRRRVSASL